MKALLMVSIAGISLLAAEEAPPRATVMVEGQVEAAPGEAVSRSQHFRVTGSDAGTRGTVALLADQTRDELRILTEERGEEDVKVPIRIMLAGKPGDPLPPQPLVMQLVFDETGYQLRVHAHLGRGIDNGKFANVLTSALVYERTLRNRRPGDDEEEYVVPPWLVEGLREATAWRLKTSDRRLYESLFKKGGLYNMDQLFGLTDPFHRELDAATLAAFRVSSGALVMALLEQPQGKEGFRAFLSEVAAYHGEMPALLRKHFPELNLSESSLSKWWALQMATMGTPPLTDSLSIADTEKTLGEVLRMQMRGEGGLVVERPVSEWRELEELEPVERIEALRAAQEGLWRLSYRSFPSYRPMLVEYQEVLTSLERWRTAKVDEKLQSLAASRELMVAKAERARDYLDWFEITRARETSGEFDDYLRLKDQLQERRHRRTDPLSKYLDRMDEWFGRGLDQPQHFASPPLLPPR